MNRYKIYTYWIKMTDRKEPGKLEDFLNELEGEVISIIPNVDVIGQSGVDFLYIITKEV